MADSYWLQRSVRFQKVRSIESATASDTAMTTCYLGFVVEEVFVADGNTDVYVAQPPIFTRGLGWEGLAREKASISHHHHHHHHQGTTSPSRLDFDITTKHSKTSFFHSPAQAVLQGLLEDASALKSPKRGTGALRPFLV